MVQAELMVTFSSITHSYFTMNQTLLYPNPSTPIPFKVHVTYQHNTTRRIQSNARFNTEVLRAFSTLSTTKP
jgi:hypothetical protein